MKLKKKWKICIVCIVIVIIGAAVCGKYFSRNTGDVTNYTAEFEKDQEKSVSSEQESGTEAGIEIPGYKSIEIPAGTKDVQVELMNPENNHVYFEIAFYLPETDETIYTSKLIKPGQHIYDLTLEHEMEAGEYPLTVKYTTYSADESMTPKNGAEVNCTLVVK